MDKNKLNRIMSFRLDDEYNEKLVELDNMNIKLPISRLCREYLQKEIDDTYNMVKTKSNQEKVVG